MFEEHDVCIFTNMFRNTPPHRVVVMAVLPEDLHGHQYLVRKLPFSRFPSRFGVYAGELTPLWHEAEVWTAPMYDHLNKVIADWFEMRGYERSQNPVVI